MLITSMAKKSKGSLNGREMQTKQKTIIQILQMNCHICAIPYNSSDHLPISFCPQQHTFCSECVSNLFSRQPNSSIRCPTCRAFVYHNATHINKTLLRLCDTIPKLTEEYITLQQQKEELEKKLEKATLFLKKKEGVQTSNKENAREVENEKQQFNGFPIIKASDYLNKPNKMNIHTYVAQRRRVFSKSEKVQKDIKLDNRNQIRKMI